MGQILERDDKMVPNLQGINESSRARERNGKRKQDIFNDLNTTLIPQRVQVADNVVAERWVLENHSAVDSRTNNSRRRMAYRCEPVSICYYFDNNLSQKYENMVREAIEDIEEAAPGIQFNDSNTAINRIRIFFGDRCQGQIGMVGGEQMLELAEWATKGHVLHELMHALGFLHEHQHQDHDLYVKCWNDDDINYGKAGLAIEKYDVNSIMHYPCKNGILENCSLRASHQSERLSNGDKTGLNILYPPVIRPGIYNPKQGSSGLYYCGRHNMENNNEPFGRIAVDGYCGLNTGPNCSSCRQYGGKQTRRNSQGRETKQGETGLFYCGVKFKARLSEQKHHDGYCGPNSGPNCQSCRRLLD